MRYICISLYFI